jgi:hypothetical protein
MIGAMTAIVLALAATPKAIPTPPLAAVDLRRIGHLQPKGRVQDREYNESQVVDALIAAGPAAIPYLVSKLEDQTSVEGPVVDFWSDVRVGDVALMILCDFFLEADWRSPTVPGLQWDALLERKNSTAPSNELLHTFLAKHGRVGLRRRIEKLLLPYAAGFVWDENERCFKPAR